MEKTDRTQVQIRSYLALRKAVGWIGILLPFTLMTGVFIFFDGKSVLVTISQYYYTGMRDVMVGALCAISLFLFFYKGYGRWDDFTANIAAFMALGVAWFPTVESGPYDAAAWIHFICASLFFAVLAGITLLLFTRKKTKITARKLLRNRIYYLCGTLMLVALAAIIIFFGFFTKKYPQSSFVFWCETVALVAFGISWLTKGGTILPDRTPADTEEP